VAHRVAAFPSAVLRRPVDLEAATVLEETEERSSREVGEECRAVEVAETHSGCCRQLRS
jgi:hypothetical protein